MKNFTTLIKESFEIYKQKIKQILLILLLCGITIIIFVGLLGGSIFFSALQLGNIENLGITNILVFFLLSIGIFLVMGLWMAFINLIFTMLAIKPIETKLKEIFQVTWKNLWQYFWIIALTSLFVMLSALFLIIPGLIVGVYLILCPYVLVIEGEKGMNALKRSWNLIKGNWWKVFGRIILLNGVFSIISYILSSINNLLSSVFQLFSLPFYAIFLYLIYLELKKSKEIQAPTTIEI